MISKSGVALAGMLAAITFALPHAAFAKAELPGDPNALITDELIQDIREWLANPVVSLSITSQNKLRKDMTQDQIDAADQQWRAEREAEDQPLVAAILTNPLSSYLTQIQARSGGLFAEIFVMDSVGLNVGQSSITSDFWQGDEAKFQNTFPNGPDAVFIDEAEYNEGSDSWRTQLNMTMSNSDRQPIGAVTVEVNLNELARRRGL
ncbi:MULTISPECIES: hypothetical protein [Thalassospira]|mgnify:FL=1|jgi:hypothetical protein|uniref:Uncharacterized protein n=1 Tax=Thalassospira profundimaris TaxID=502049 RepID=A0A367V9I9_9PROT|nr:MULTISPECIES: hypothetical protein [Thalassospira]MBC44642.1 hypothetical protein [Thalassospira sp.]MBR9901633.1 hypothetical protein [Rhodospirillales bacterium]KZB70334.1 hypothetical protein AUQ43_13405 [Thalassospira sp. MCCC 1A01148]MBS8274521.1 hypothetical protein [Thalassospira tepidiphila]RCK21032.1 hypothetical protein TH6_14740 [Thalassospira profundimaris]|tara:strand:+ start:136 stop:753 length:618 start_codon:yes stop_codon:yes gene_type:complete